MTDDNQHLPAPAQPSAVATSAPAIWHVPENFQQGLELAEHIVRSGLAPSGMDTPQKVFITLCMGSELGLMPMQSLQSFHVIKGRVVPKADTYVALVLKSGLCEWIRPLEQSDDRAVWQSKRVGDLEPYEPTVFTMDDAKKAGLTGGDNWRKYPARMLSARAKAYHCRDHYPEIVGGLLSAEEIEDMRQDANARASVQPPPTRNTTPQPPPKRATTDEVDAKLVKEAAEKAIASLVAEHGLSEGDATRQLRDAVKRLPNQHGKVTPEHISDALKIVHQALEGHDPALDELMVLEGVAEARAASFLEQGIESIADLHTALTVNRKIDGMGPSLREELLKQTRMLWIKESVDENAEDLHQQLWNAICESMVATGVAEDLPKAADALDIALRDYTGAENAVINDLDRLQQCEVWGKAVKICTSLAKGETIDQSDGFATDPDDVKIPF